MATKQESVDNILDKLKDVENVFARKMFGEYALYFNGKVVALICDDTLFIKITEPGKKFVDKYYQEGRAYPGAKPSMKINDELLENHQWISQLIKITADALPASKPKKKIIKEGRK